jgi:hypothetical protein
MAAAASQDTAGEEMKLVQLVGREIAGCCLTVEVEIAQLLQRAVVGFLFPLPRTPGMMLDLLRNHAMASLNTHLERFFVSQASLDHKTTSNLG